MLGPLRKFAPPYSSCTVLVPVGCKPDGVRLTAKGIPSPSLDAVQDSRPRLAGVHLRSDLDDEIASENRAVSHIEEAMDNYVPPRCSFCTAWALDWCSLCERPMCEDDAIADGICIECDAEVLS